MDDRFRRRRSMCLVEVLKRLAKKREPLKRLNVLYSQSVVRVAGPDDILS